MIELLMDRLKFGNEEYNSQIIKCSRRIYVEKLIKPEFISIGK
jgi:hypothetical protein